MRGFPRGSLSRPSEGGHGTRSVPGRTQAGGRQAGAARASACPWQDACRIVAMVIPTIRLTRSYLVAILVIPNKGMAMSNLRKITISVPPDLVAHLDYLSDRLGVSRSALISQLLDEPVGDMVELIRAIPEDPAPEDSLRFRGASAALVRQRLEAAKRLADDLFSGEAPDR